MAKPTVVDSTSNTGATSSTITADLPTYSAGDLLVVVTEHVSMRTVTTPSTWTLVRQADNSNGTTRTNVFAKIAEGTEGSTLSVSLSNTSGGHICCALAISGAADIDTTPIVQDALQSGSGVNFLRCPDITATDADSLVLRIGVANTGTQNLTDPSGTTRVVQQSFATTFDTVGVAEQTAAQAAGATGTADFTSVSTSSFYVGFTLAIAPDAAPVAPTISSVTLTGTSQIGNTLTATVVTDQDPVDSTAYQWEKASDGSGTGAADISGETSSTLALTYADFGDLLDTAAYVRCGAIATKNALPSDEAFSAWQQVTVASGGGFSGSPLKSPFLIS